MLSFSGIVTRLGISPEFQANQFINLIDASHEHVSRNMVSAHFQTCESLLRKYTTLYIVRKASHVTYLINCMWVHQHFNFKVISSDWADERFVS